MGYADFQCGSGAAMQIKWYVKLHRQSTLMQQILPGGSGLHSHHSADQMQLYILPGCCCCLAVASGIAAPFMWSLKLTNKRALGVVYDLCRQMGLLNAWYLVHAGL